jgi:hypothetical protein
MPSIHESLCHGEHPADLTRLNTFLDFLATKLSADDYHLAHNLLWAAFDPVVAVRLHTGNPPPPHRGPDAPLPGDAGEPPPTAA